MQSWVGCTSLLLRTIRGKVVAVLDRVMILVICRYKEGRVILERALVQECDGIEEHPVSD